MHSHGDVKIRVYQPRYYTCTQMWGIAQRDWEKPERRVGIYSTIWNAFWQKLFVYLFQFHARNEQEKNEQCFIYKKKNYSACKKKTRKTFLFWIKIWKLKAAHAQSMLVKSLNAGGCEHTRTQYTNGVIVTAIFSFKSCACTSKASRSLALGQRDLYPH